MKKLQLKTKISTIALILVLTISATLVALPAVNAQDDLLQYEWPSPDGDRTSGFLTAGGPAPNTQEIRWTSNLGEPVSAFNGMVFLSTGWVVDAFTGTPMYQHLGSGATKISETQFMSTVRPSMFSPVKIGTIYVYETNTGQLLYEYSIPNGIPAARSGQPAYDQDLGMFWTLQGEPFFGMDHIIYAWDWADVSQEPTLKWEKTIQKGMGTKEFFDGYIFIGTSEMTCICLDGETGEFLWEIPLEGDLGYSGSYFEGKYIHATFDQIYCMEAATGNILWTFNPGTFWNFWANMGSIYNGMIYNINTDYNTYALDLETGEVVWKFESEQGSGYQGPTIAAGGYVYAYTGRSGGVYDDPETGVPFEDEYVCLDAETGELLWKTDTVAGGGGGGPPGINNIIAYGNLYVQSTFASCVCYGPPGAWSSFKGNAENTGDGGRNGPAKLDVKWISQLDSAILTSPVAANNKIYVGTVLGTFYAIDHMTGDPVWTFKTDEDMKVSSPAYDSGRIYFVSDNGYQYCLNAETGTEVWKTYIGSDVEYLFHGRYRKTSSPTIVNGRVYVGSRDFKFYCLNAVNGAIIWDRNLGGLISATAAVSDGAVYIPVGGTSELTREQTGGVNGTLFKLNTANGDIIWQAGLPYVYAGGFGFGQWQPREFHGSPVVADGMVFQSANAWTTYGLNATNGQIIWDYSVYSGGMQNDITPAYADGKVYVQSFFSLACLDASNGTKLWEVWGAHAVHGDPIIAFGKVYFASDFKVMWSIDADTGEKIDFIKWDDTCYSGGCIYDNKLYWGTAGMKLYCFEDEPYGETTYYRAEPEPPQPPEQVPPTLEELLSPLQSSVDELRGSIAEMEGAISDLEGAVSSIEDSVSAVEGSVSSIAGSVSEVEGSVNSLESSLSDLESSVGELETKLAANTSNLTTYLLAILMLVIVALVIAVYSVLRSRKKN